MPRCRPLLALVALLGLVAASPALAQERRVLTTAHASATTACPETACLEIGGHPNGVSVEINDTAGGTWQAEMEMTLSGAEWTGVDMTPIAGGSAVELATAGGKWRGAAGMRFRVRLSARTSGNVEVLIKRLDFPPTAAGAAGGGGGGGGDFDIATFQTTFGTTGLFRTATLADDIAATVDSLYTTALNTVYDGTTFDLMRGDSTNGVLVNLGANNDVTVTSGNITVSDGSGALNVIVDSSALPSGAATSANQSTEITSLQALDNALGTVAAGTAGTQSYLAGGVYNSAGITLTNGQQAALQFTAAGALKMDLSSVSGSSPTSAICDDPAKVTTFNINLSAGTGNTELVALNGSDLVYVCSFAYTTGGADTPQLIYGTGTACATGETDLMTMNLVAAGDGWIENGGGSVITKAPAGNALCLERTNSVTGMGKLLYVRQP